MDTLTYNKLLRIARRHTRRADEAEDLLHAVLLAAIDARRSDMTRPANRSWLIGALKKRALFDARTAIRRRRRESLYVSAESVLSPCEALPTQFINTLSSALRTTTRLVLSGHTRKEISWLLRISDAALRQRIVEIRRRWRKVECHSFAEIPGLKGELCFGRLRKSAIKLMHRENTFLASHDSDGHVFLLTSQNRMPRQPACTLKTKQE